jgi:polygalacturonase
MIQLQPAVFSLWWILAPAAVFSQNTPAVLPTAELPAFRKDTISILHRGGKPDGSTLNTGVINQAIELLASRGGGVVLVPPGLWLTGPIEIKSNINLHLASGATLLFTDDFTQYPLIRANWEGIPQMRNQSPISASNAENIAITGQGIIDGNGDAWRMVRRDKLSESQWKKLTASGGVLSDDQRTWYPSEKSRRGAGFVNPGAIQPDKNPAFYDSVKDFLRPNMLLMTSCRRILLEGVTFQNSPAWCLHPLMCEDLTVQGISVKNPWYAQNGDGIDVESCRNVVIENSVFDVGDDALCIKSGRDAEGRKRGMPTANVLIRNCTVYAAHGGFVIGSEMSGGARDIWVYNCTFIGTDIGLRFKTTRGRGGVVENIHVRDIYMKDIQGEAILFDMYYAARDPIPLAGEQRALPKVEFKPVDVSTPVFRNFNIQHVYCNGAAQAIYVRGLPEMHVSGIVMENMSFVSKKGIYLEEGSDIRLENIYLATKHSDPVVEIIQSKDIHFKSISTSAEPRLKYRISGSRSARIQPERGVKAGQIAFDLGATEKSIHQ